MKRIIALILIFMFCFTVNVWAEEDIKIRIDDFFTKLDTSPFLIEGRTMIPVRGVLEILGAIISWDGKTQTVAAKRADVEVRMIINQKTAYINGVAVELDVAPILKDGHTYVPLRVISEAFNQDVTWDSKYKIVNIKEKPVRYTQEQLWWGYAVAANLTTVNNGSTRCLGGVSRRPLVKRPKSTDESPAAIASFHRDLLSSGWGIDDREECIKTLQQLYRGMHNEVYLEVKYVLDAMTDKQFSEMMKDIKINDQAKAEINFVKKYDKELGDRGIIGWDWSRMVSVTGWGYLAGYLSYEEATEIIMGVAQSVQKVFDSWDDIGLSYVRGYEFWSGESVDTQGSGAAYRMDIHKKLINYENSPYNTLPWNMSLEPDDNTKTY
ncbi:hypothetical protein HNQ80_003987 [Anaerosolibacter carboniphilus]|uniref:Copper amine oxidase N-terminal domain-containing protein n=1 Tax=Anaerosolibacter carboniphilus TaxID=1417629 RepID=A0A841KWM8_9FIRM|nr:DUF1266 domain-containing protein [Anaerosolibacter carboniphilus]MBB6217851.1 hypothetical protein [Anaerosolibacter carboniphilus]